MAIEREGVAVEITASTDDFVGGIGQAIQSLGGFRVATIAAAAATVGAFGVAGVRSFAEFEGSMEMARQKMRLSEADMAVMNRGIEAISESTAGAAFSEAQLASALNAVAQGSRSAEDTLSVMNAAVALTATRGGDLAENADALSRVLDSLGLSGDDATRVVEQIRAAADFAGVSFNELADRIVSVQSRARNFGLTLEETAAITAALASRGQDARLMFSAFGSLEDPDSSSAKALGQTFGVDVRDANGDMKSFHVLMEDINAAIAGQGKTVEEAGRMLASVFGDKAGAVIQTYRLSTLELGAAQVAVGNSTGQLAKDVEASSTTSAAKIGELRAAWSDTLTAFGGAAAPIAIPFLESLTSKLNDITTSLEGIPSLFGAMKDGMSEEEAAGITSMMQGIIDFFNLQPAVNWLTSLAEFDVWGKIGGAFTTARTNIANWVGGAGEWFSGIGAAIKTKWDEAGAAISGFVDDAKAWVVGLKDDALTWGRDFIANFVAGVQQKWNELKKDAQAVWDSITNIFSHDIAANDARAAKWGSDFVKYFAQGMQSASPLLSNAASLPLPAGSAPGAAAPGGDVYMTVNVTLPNVSNARQFTDELRSQEFTSQYRNLSSRRGVVG